MTTALEPRPRVAVFAALRRTTFVLLTYATRFALIALPLGAGSFAINAVAAPVVVQAACDGWISTDSSGSSPKIGHTAQDSSSGSTTWSTGNIRIEVPSSFYCKSWLRTYVYNGIATGQSGTDWRGNYYWVPMNPSGSSSNCTYAGTTNANNSGITDYMKQYTSSCVNAAFPVAANATAFAVSQNTTYTNWGIGYASCTTYYSAQTVISQASGASSPAAPGANCGTPAWRAPDLNMTVPKLDWSAPTTTFSSPATGTTGQSSTSVTVTWSESDTGGSGVSTRSLQRQRGVVVTNGTCTGVSWANDGTASTSASPVSATGLLSGYCYKWLQTLTDIAGNQSVTTSGQVIVDTVVPTALISTPEDGRSLAGDVQVTGTASDALSFLNYTLDYGAGVSPSSWTTLTTSTMSITNGTLFTWPTAGLQGVYTLRLTVHDLAGNVASDTSLVYLENSRRGDEGYRTRVPFDLGGGWRMAVGVANGELTLDRQLFSIPSYGPPQSLALHYSSSVSDGGGMFGTGWTSDLTQYLSFESGFVVWHRADGGLVPFGQVGGVWTALAGHFETLSFASGQYTVTAKDQTTLVFSGSSPGRLVKIQNRFGKALTFVWNTNSATATDASGRATTLTISGGVITGASDSAGRAWGFGYTGSSLTSITDPASKVTTLGYTSALLTSVSRQRTPASGPVQTVLWSVAYSSGKAASVTDPVNATVANTFTYNSGSTVVGLLKTYAPIYNSWTYTFDNLGRVTSTLDPNGYTTSYAFDASSNLTSLVLPIQIGPPAVGQTLGYTYDARGNVLTQTTQVTATDTDITALSYNTTNDVLTRSDADNDSTNKRVTRYAYDGAGHLTSSNENCTTNGTTPPADASTCTGAGTQDSTTNLMTSYTYTSNDQLDTETDPLGTVTKHLYDAYGNQTSATANYVSGGGSTADQNVVTSSIYDQQTSPGKAGLPTATTDAVGATTTYSYDASGRELSEVLPGDSSIPVVTRSTGYDELGNMLTETESYTGGSRTTTYVYDLANREISVTDQSGGSVSTSYDAAGNATTTVTSGITTTNSYDGVGDLLSATVDGAITTYGYDGQGRQLSSQDAAGVVTTDTYDLAGRQLTEAAPVQLPDGTIAQAVTSKTWDILGQIGKIVSSSGSETVSLYDRPGRRVSSAVDGSATLTAYDRDGNDIQSTAPDSAVTATSYDHMNRPSSLVVNKVDNPTGPTQSVTTQTYLNAAGRAVAVVNAAGFTTRTIYNVRGLATETIANCTDSGTTPTTNPAACVGAGTHDSSTNVVTLIAYDGFGQIASVTSAQGTSAAATTNFAYDGAGRKQAVQDSRGTVTRYLYDSAGRETSTIFNCTLDTSNPTPPTTNWWNCTGSALHDGTWNVTTSRTYDAKGNVDTETAPNGRVTKSIYDASGRLVQQIDNYVTGNPAADQNISTYHAYDAAGHESAVRVPTTDRSTFAVARYFYDANGALSEEVRNCTNTGKTTPPDPDWKTCSATGTADFETNVVTQYAYDLRGNAVAVTVPDPSASTTTSTATVTTRYVFDALSRLCRLVENATVDPYTLADPCSTAISGTVTTNVSVRYVYDGVGNMTAAYDGRGNVTKFGYDALGNVLTHADPADPNGPAGNATTYAYDALGRKVSQSVRGGSGTLVSWAYDAAGRVLTRTADSATTSYAYDAGGNRLTATNPAGTITTTYDRLNRPLTVADSADSGNSSSYTYSLTAPLWVDPSGSYSATLDAFGRQLSVLEPIHSTAFVWTYRADGQPATGTMPSSLGMATTYGYDLLGDLASKATEKSQGHQARATYAWTRNRAGQILTENSSINSDPTNGTATYGYDSLGQLVTYQLGSNPTSTYGWQALPNRSSVQVGNNPAVTTSFDVANRPTTGSDGSSYSSDAEGRLTARPGQTLVWDSVGRLTEVRNSSTQAVIADYTYDALDRLRTAGTSSGRIRFRYVGLTTSAAQTVDDIGGSIIRSIAHDSSGAALLDWTGTGSDQRIYGTNLHGDVTWTATSAASVSATLRYDPWGNLVASFGSSLPDFRFQGSWADAGTQLSWAIARWYAPALGRFISEDPAPGRIETLSSWDQYAYGAGDPVDRVDLDGRYWYKVRETMTIGYLAYIRGLTWREMFHANRSLVAQSPSALVYEGQCVYVPWEWNRAHKDPAPGDQCISSVPRPSLQGAFLGSTSWSTWLAAAQTAVGKSGQYLMDWTRDWLYNMTDTWTKRPRQPSDLWKLGLLADQNMWLMNTVSWAVANYDHASGYVWATAPNVVRVDSGAPPWCQSQPCTFGQWIFLNGYPGRRTLMAHEYIHVLEFEGQRAAMVTTYLGSAFKNALFGLDLSRLQDFATWPSTFKAIASNTTLPQASNIEEAPAYLWQAFIGTAPSFDDPWNTWRPAGNAGLHF